MDHDDFMDDFNNAKVLYRDLGSALLMKEYNKCISDIGSLNVDPGDKLIVKSMFLPSSYALPPWAYEEGIVLEDSQDAVKILFDTHDVYHCIWIPKWAIQDHVKNKDETLRKKFTKLAKDKSITSFKKSKKSDIKAKEDIINSYKKELVESITKTTNGATPQTITIPSPRGDLIVPMQIFNAIVDYIDLLDSEILPGEDNDDTGDLT